MKKKNNLTWLDVKNIIFIADAIMEDYDCNRIIEMGPDGYYKEVLRLYNENFGDDEEA